MLKSCPSSWLYFRTRLLSDMETDNPSELVLTVDPGEVDAAVAVIGAMYDKVPEVLTACQLVSVWKLADHLQAHNTDLWVQKLIAMEMDWETALLVSLWESWANQKFFLLPAEPVTQACRGLSSGWLFQQARDFSWHGEIITTIQGIFADAGNTHVIEYERIQHLQGSETSHVLLGALHRRGAQAMLACH